MAQQKRSALNVLRLQKRTRKNNSLLLKVKNPRYFTRVFDLGYKIDKYFLDDTISQGHGDGVRI